jgi:hypothetical protein
VVEGFLVGDLAQEEQEVGAVGVGVGPGVFEAVVAGRVGPQGVDDAGGLLWGGSGGAAPGGTAAGGAEPVPFPEDTGS